MMTPAKLRLIALEKQKAEVKQFYENLANAVKEVAAEIGVGGMFQDEEGTVYQIIEPEGKFVHFEKLSVIRTKRPGEERGELSAKKAQEAGFILPK